MKPKYKKTIDSQGNIRRFLKIKSDCDFNPYEPVGIIDDSIKDLIGKNITQNELLKKIKIIGIPTTYKRRIKQGKSCWIQIQGRCEIKIPPSDFIKSCEKESNKG